MTISKQEARGYALDCSIDALTDDLGDLEAFPLDSPERRDALNLLEGMIRACDRHRRRYWEDQVMRHKIR